jgi:hypothetical protein
MRQCAQRRRRDGGPALADRPSLRRCSAEPTPDVLQLLAPAPPRTLSNDVDDHLSMCHDRRVGWVDAPSRRKRETLCGSAVVVAGGAPGLDDGVAEAFRGASDALDQIGVT